MYYKLIVIVNDCIFIYHIFSSIEAFQGVAHVENDHLIKTLLGVLMHLP